MDPVKVDRAWTVALDICLLFLVPVLLFVGTFYLALATNVQLYESAQAGSVVLLWGVLGFFVLAVGLSIVFLAQGWRAFYIPLVGGILMIAACILACSISGYPPPEPSVTVVSLEDRRL